MTIPARRVPSDSCAVTIGGALVHPHVGEWVEVVGAPTVRETRDFQRMLEQALAAQSPSENGEGQVRVSAEFDALFDGFCAVLGARVVRWSLTDDAGAPLPQPDGTAEPIKALHTEEVYWLWQAYRGLDLEVDRKNASNGSGATSARSRGRETRSPSRRD